jgi:hypothetical protein
MIDLASEMLVERIGRPYPCPRDTTSFELARKRPLSSITAPYPRIRLYREDTADTAGRCKGGAETSSLCPHPSPFNLGADTGWDTLQIRWIRHASALGERSQLKHHRQMTQLNRPALRKYWWATHLRQLRSTFAPTMDGNNEQSKNHLRA